jgi:hypothetical protein
MHQVSRRLLVDIIVARVEQSAVWDLTDLLGRPMGTIAQDQKGFFISPIGEAAKTMQRVNCGPHASLDKALAEIETRTRGVCRRE